VAAERVLIVTGGGRGIGAETARLAAERGYKVAVNYRENRDAAVSLIKTLKAKAIAVQADVASEADVVRLFETVDRELGPVTALVNNAGVVDRGTRVAEMSAARIARMFAINITGSFLCAREAIKRMSKRRGGPGGAIVNVSSIAARLGGAGEYVDYAAAKGAIDTFTVGLAKEVGPEGIRVNAVRPGIIRTEIHIASGDPGRVERIGATAPLERPGEAIEVARAIVWLLSEEASYMSGALVDVSGGR
jgi:NAD(P)-dependent dehydrogenase (short-subunit alcohol dehydrogenase family)